MARIRVWNIKKEKRCNNPDCTNPLRDSDGMLPITAFNVDALINGGLFAQCTFCHELREQKAREEKEAQEQKAKEARKQKAKEAQEQKAKEARKQREDKRKRCGIDCKNPLTGPDGKLPYSEFYRDRRYMIMCNHCHENRYLLNIALKERREDERILKKQMREEQKQLKKLEREERKKVMVVENIEAEQRKKEWREKRKERQIRDAKRNEQKRLIDEQVKQREEIKGKKISESGLCSILKRHAKDLADDPNRLSTDFILKASKGIGRVHV